MRVALGADHAGVTLKDDIKHFLDERGITYIDFGTQTTDSVDYPDYAARVAAEVSAGRAERGILFCGSGIGMAMAANKFAGVRAAPVLDERSAELSREHNDANVLALGERFTPPDLARRLVALFLDTPFGGGRHARRVDKINALDHDHTPSDLGRER
jgi:ribose 5-phosphate isomerase B